MSKPSIKQREYEKRRQERLKKANWKRKYKYYDPNSNFFRAKRVKKQVDLNLRARHNFSVIQDREEVLGLFRKARVAVSQGKSTLMDLSGVITTDLATVSLLICFMMDKEILQSRLFSVTSPASGTPAKALLIGCDFHQQVTKEGYSTKSKFLSRSDNKDNEDYKLSILTQAEEYLNGKEKIKGLGPILTEVFTNTNNHANPNKLGSLDWFASISALEGQDRIAFCVVDLGVGIYSSIEKKITHSVKDRITDINILARFKDTSSQGKFLKENIPLGIRSRTKDLNRGKGLKKVNSLANDGSYSKFVIITNRAEVSLLNSDDYIEDSNEDFKGTLYYWEIEKNAVY